MPFLEWVHSITAGVDHILCPAISENDELILTNAKGVFSSSLAEYVMTACSYFAKDIPRLMKQKTENVWEKFCVTELRNKTMGIIGYGRTTYIMQYMEIFTYLLLPQEVSALHVQSLPRLMA